jgi:hypothetical protein
MTKRGISQAVVTVLGVLFVFWIIFSTHQGKSKEVTASLEASSLKETFKNTYVKGCMDADPFSSTQKDVCGCIADEALKRMTVRQFMDQEFAGDYIEKNIAPLCEGRSTQDSAK